MNTFCQLGPILGYSYFLRKIISYFAIIYDVDICCFIAFSQFKYILLKVFSPSKNGTTISKRKTVQFLMVYVALWRRFILPEVNIMQLYWQILKIFLLVF